MIVVQSGVDRAWFSVTPVIGERGAEENPCQQVQDRLKAGISSRTGRTTSRCIGQVTFPLHEFNAVPPRCRACAPRRFKEESNRLDAVGDSASFLLHTTIGEIETIAEVVPKKAKATVHKAHDGLVGLVGFIF